MLTEIGHVEAIFRYPVKSMRGERLEAAELGWHGIEGDRRLAFRRIEDRSGMPWLTATKLSQLVLFTPLRREEGTGPLEPKAGFHPSPRNTHGLGPPGLNGAPDLLPTHVRTPEGEEMPVFGDELAKDIERRYGAPVQMMQLRHGIFDDASLSVIASATVNEIGRLAGLNFDVQNLDVPTFDVRRFRPNVFVRLLHSAPFEEDKWLGGVLSFGEGDDAPAIAITMRDERCAMVNLDPDTAKPAPEVMKAIVRANQNCAGIYGAVTRIGRLAVGQRIFLSAKTER